MAELPATANGRGSRHDAAAARPGLVAGTVFDEAAAELARNYAEALLDAAGDAGRGRPRRAGGDSAPTSSTAQPQFAELLAPRRSSAGRQGPRSSSTPFEGRAMPTVVRFLRVLNRHGRLGLLGPILGQARDAGTASRAAAR